MGKLVGIVTGLTRERRLTVLEGRMREVKMLVLTMAVEHLMARL